MSTVKIKTIADYLKVIEEKELGNCISRGEPRKYDDIIASAFRPYSQSGLFYGQKHLDEFYSYVGNDLSDMQQEHLIALAQHSGLPTYLIDFTLSPLISLFFACNGDERTSTENGYVHFISKKRLFPIDSLIKNGYNCALTSQINEKDENSHIVNEWLNFLQAVNVGHVNYDHSSILLEIQKMINSLLDIIAKQEDDFSQSDMNLAIRDLCDFMKNQKYEGLDPNQYIVDLFSSGIDTLFTDLVETIYNMIDAFNKGSALCDILRIEGMSDIMDVDTSKPYDYYGWKNDETDPADEFEKSWGDIIRRLLIIVEGFAPYSTAKNFSLPFYCTYSPPNISGRVSMQNSVFVSQIHHSVLRRRNEPDPWDILLTQKIIPDITIEIENRQYILEELDMLGINLKTIFGDYDNIAKYIKNSLYKEKVNGL